MSLNSIYDSDYVHKKSQANICPKYNLNNKSPETLSDKFKIGCIIDTDDSESKSERKTRQIEITLQLGLYNPKPNETYQLLIYSSRDVQKDPRCKQVIEVKTDKDYKILYDMPWSPRIPKSFHVWLFTTTFIESTHSRVQTLLAWGKIPTIILLSSNPETVPSFRLVDNDEDVKQQTQGLITLVLSNETDRKFFKDKIFESREFYPAVKMVPDEYVSDSSTLAIKQIERAYSTYRCEPSLQYFTYIRTPIGKLPLLSFPLLGCNDLSYVDSEAEALFNRWFFYAGIILGHSDDMPIQLARFEKLSDADKMEWLSEMVTLVARALMYRNDTVRLTGDRFKFVDQWVRLGSFPNLELAAFDCEDAAEYSLELLNIFQNMTISNSSAYLQRLQKLLSCYTIFLAIGQINLDPFSGKTPAKYTAHAFVICLDTRYIEDLIKDESLRFLSRTPDARQFYPSVIIDPTNYQESVWNNQLSINNRMSSDDNARMQQLFNMPAFTSSKNNLWEFMIHSKVPMADVKKHGVYGPLTALITTDISNPRQYQKKQSMHLLFINNTNQEERPSIGIKIDELLNYRPRSKSMQVFIASTLNRDKSNEEDRQLLIDMQGLPPVSLPVIKYPTIRNSIIENPQGKTKMRFFFIRYSDYMIPEYKETIHKGIEQFCKYYNTQIWELGNDLKLVVIILYML